MTRRLVLACFFAPVACVDQGEKPPPPTCQGHCGNFKPPVIHDPPPDGGSSGAGGESGTDDEPVRVVGDVVLLNDIAASAAVAFVDAADVRAQGINGEVLGRWNGIDPFSLDGIPQRPAVWTEVTPLAGDALVTLQPMNTLEPDSGVVETRLAVVSASEIELALGAISVPLAPNSQRAQAVLVATKNDVPTAGVSVSVVGAEAVIYLDGGVYTDVATETDDSGVVVLANVPIPSTGAIVVRYSGEVSGNAELRLVAGGVTYGGLGY